MAQIRAMYVNCSALKESFWYAMMLFALLPGAFHSGTNTATSTQTRFSHTIVAIDFTASLPRTKCTKGYLLLPDICRHFDACSLWRITEDIDYCAIFREYDIGRSPRACFSETFGLTSIRRFWWSSNIGRMAGGELIVSLSPQHAMTCRAPRHRILHFQWAHWSWAYTDDHIILLWHTAPSYIDLIIEHLLLPWERQSAIYRYGWFHL